MAREQHIGFERNCKRRAHGAPEAGNERRTKGVGLLRLTAERLGNGADQARIAPRRLNLDTHQPTRRRAATVCTGGLAIGDLSIGSASSIDATYSDAGKTRIDMVNWSGNDSTWKLGYAVGGGAEYALSPRASTTLEALYYNLGSTSATITGTGNESIDYTDPNETDTSRELTVEPYKAKLKADGVIARIGFNFKF
jgi:hypothetical protein